LGPTDQAYRFDPASGSITFGNGINGAIPAPSARITATYWTSEGDAGNRPLGMSWLVPRIGVYGVNLDPMSGGAATETLDDTRRRARSTLNTPLIVTDGDLIAAARALAGLRVMRAEILQASTADATRTLLALRRQDALSNSVAIRESPRWLSAVAKALRPRLLLGERLRVVGPEYVPVQLTLQLVVAAKTDPAVVRQQVLQSLPPHFSSYATDLAPTPWAIGEALDVQTIRGWLRSLPGVLQVASVTLTGGGVVVSNGSLSLPPRGLPQVSLTAADVTITQAGATR
jgi:predicted phage baseplate assembly protein